MSSRGRKRKLSSTTQPAKRFKGDPNSNKNKSSNSNDENSNDNENVNTIASQFPYKACPKRVTLKV